MAAERLGKQAAIFLPTGILSNQIGIALHTKPGQAIVVESRSHIVNWEGAGAAANSGLQLRPVASDQGLPSITALEGTAWPDHPKAPLITLLCLENTHNGAGGVPHDAQSVSLRGQWAQRKGFAVHLDGARLFNAEIATGDSVADLGAQCDTVNICLSKGLGAPIGSILAGPKALIEEADRIRHRMGAGWRQGGILAAAGIYALNHHVLRLRDDHDRAKLIAEALAASGVAEAFHDVKTNLVCYRVDETWGSAAAFTRSLAEQGVLVLHTGPTTGRLVTHLGINDEDVTRTIEAIRSL
jgi:threonine aldolase